MCVTVRSLSLSLFFSKTLSVRILRVVDLQREGGVLSTKELKLFPFTTETGWMRCYEDKHLLIDDKVNKKFFFFFYM